MPLKPAIVGAARLNNFRLGYRPAALTVVRLTKVRITLAGVPVNVRVGSVTIHDTINDAPNTCQLTVDASTPPVAAQRLRITINSDTPRLLFAGRLQTITLRYEGRPSQVLYECTAIDDTSAARARLPFGSWTLISATTVAQELVAAFAPGFTSVNVQGSLPLISIDLNGTEGLNGALVQIAKLIGGYFYWEDNDLHLFQTETGDAPDTLDATPGRFLDVPPIQIRREDSQIRTRVYGKGLAASTLQAVAAGGSSIPVSDASMFDVAGGKAISDTQIITYTSAVPGTTPGVALATVAGTPQTPSAPTVTPSASVLNGSLIGAYRYWVAFVSPLGESDLSAYAGTTAQGVPDTSIGSFTATASGAGAVDSGLHYWFVTPYTAQGQPAFGSAAGGATLTVGAAGAVVLTSIPTSSDPRAIGRRLWRTKAGVVTTDAAHVFLVATLDNVVTTYTDTASDASLTQTAPFANTAGGGQITVSAIPLGPTGTTVRKLYRSVAGGTSPKALTIINDNVTTSYVDRTDGGVNDDPPNAGLSAVGAAIGDTTLRVSDLALFSAAGGWLQVASQTLRFTGRSASSGEGTLTGIPASGAGSITVVIPWLAAITVAPALNGVTGLVRPLLKGATINLWIQRDDVPAQAARAAVDGTDGIIEHLITDERRGAVSLAALCDADLLQFSRALVTVTYASRDVKTKSGKRIVISLATPLIGATLTVQDVTISELDVAPGIAPKFTVEASSVHFSLEDLLRRLTKAEGLY